MAYSFLKAALLKPRFRQTADEWHLAALETEADGTAGAGLLAFVSLAGGLALAGAFALAEALDAMLRHRGGF